MITRHKIPFSIRTVEDLVQQKDLKWAIDAGSALYLSTSQGKPGSVMR